MIKAVIPEYKWENKRKKKDKKTIEYLSYKSFYNDYSVIEVNKEREIIKREMDDIKIEIAKVSKILDEKTYNEEIYAEEKSKILNLLHQYSKEFSKLYTLNRKETTSINDSIQLSFKL